MAFTECLRCKGPLKRSGCDACGIEWAEAQSPPRPPAPPSAYFSAAALMMGFSLLLPGLPWFAALVSWPTLAFGLFKRIWVRVSGKVEDDFLRILLGAAVGIGAGLVAFLTALGAALTCILLQIVVLDAIGLGGP